MRTPGPWTIEQDDMLQGMPFIPIFAPSASGEKRICEVAPELLADGTFTITEETRTNARLIVASPTLLNMIKWCVNHDGECLGDHPELLEAARMAIAELEP